MDFTLKSVLALVLVAVPAAYGMELYVGACVTGDFAAILENLGFFSVIVGTLVLASALVLRLALRPLARADAALARGAALPLPEREAALGVVLRVQTLVIATMLLGFLVGPAVMMGVQTALGKGHYGDGLWARLLAVNFSIGLMAGTQIVVLVDGILREPLARLGARRFPKGRRPVSVRGRILLAGLASTLLCGVLTAAAGNLAPAGPGVGVLLLLCLLWSFLLCSSVGSTLAGRISLLGGRVDALASGGGDLSERLPLLREDEIGKLSGSLNAFLDELASILGSVRGLSRRVSEGSESLAETSGHAGASLEGLESSLAAVRQAAERQSETVGGAEGEIARMLESVETVAARVGEQASAVEQSSAAVSEMAANVASVSRTAGRADELARKLTEASAEGGGAIKASLEAIGEIEAASKAVRDIVGVISKIAAQTNLLAMNAAIEAAHAGEAGTGFAVVADEVRGLAESAARSAKEIVGLIKEMGQKIDRGSSLADRAGAAFERIDQGVAETGELVRTIAASMSEQRQGAEEILGSVNALTDATQRIKDLTLEQREQSSAIGDAIRRIVGASNEIFEAVQEQTGGTQALGRAVQAVAGEAARNREAVRGLDALVSKFRLTEES